MYPVRHFALVTPSLDPATRDLVRQLDILRGALRVSMTTIRKMKRGQKVDTGPVLAMLGNARMEAKEVADSVKDSKRSR